MAGEARIVGGANAIPNDWAAQVFITIDEFDEDPARNCPGTLIDFTTILVSGYCNKFNHNNLIF